MNPNLCEEADEVAHVLTASVEAAGGINLLRHATKDAGMRSTAAELLDELGVWELDPLSDATELEVAAAVSRVAGAFALPYPVVERLTGDGSSAAVALVPESGAALVSHADLPLDWSGVDQRGGLHDLEVASSGPLGAALAPFASWMRTSQRPAVDRPRAALASTLQSWWLLGLLEHALADTVAYTQEREQFGKPLIRFQGVGFQLADMTVAVQSLAELAKYTLWRLRVSPAEAVVDAVGLRSAAQQAAAVVLRGAHQLHGAMGFTDEVDVSWLSRAAQLARRTPADTHATSALLAEMIAAGGWAEFGR